MVDRGSSETGGYLVLVVSGMTCSGCAGAVTRALAAVPGVVAVQVDLAGGRATVTGKAYAADLIRAVQDAGFSGELA